MKTINETFTDEEFKRILKVKELNGLNWHDWILSRIKTSREENFK